MWPYHHITSGISNASPDLRNKVSAESKVCMCVMLILEILYSFCICACYLAVRYTPGCEVPTDSSGPQRSSCSWFSCCTHMRGCPWDTLHTPLWPPGKREQEWTLKVPHYYISCSINDTHTYCKKLNVMSLSVEGNKIFYIGLWT